MQDREIWKEIVKLCGGLVALVPERSSGRIYHVTELEADTCSSGQILTSPQAIMVGCSPGKLSLCVSLLLLVHLGHIGAMYIFAFLGRVCH